MPYYQCPLKEVPDGFIWWLKAYTMLEHGILPHGGGWLDQTNKYIEVMGYIERDAQRKAEQDGKRTKINSIVK